MALARPFRLAVGAALCLFFCPVTAIGATAPELSGRMLIAANASAGSLAVIFPDVAEPYRSLFSQIIQGITEGTGMPVVSIPLGATASLQDVSSALRLQNIHTVFALGRNGLKMAGALGHDVAVVGGCVISVPEAEVAGKTIFSLTPDPALLFARLKALKPGVTRVHVVYEPSQSGWLIRRAQEAARALRLELVPHEAADLKTALRAYQDILADIDPRRDSLWLPQDTTTVEETTVLPLLLEEAWNHELVLFSSNVAHVKRGALFSLYPDPREFGRHLGSWAVSPAQAPQGGLVPLTEVLSAVNVRTAAHLGVRFTDAQMRSFNLVFPEN